MDKITQPNNTLMIGWRHSSGDFHCEVYSDFDAVTMNSVGHGEAKTPFEAQKLAIEDFWRRQGLTYN